MNINKKIIAGKKIIIIKYPESKYYKSKAAIKIIKYYNKFIFPKLTILRNCNTSKPKNDQFKNFIKVKIKE